MKLRTGRPVAMAIGCLGMLPGAQVLAQDDGGAIALDEVVVTARKVEERIQDVPLAIQVLSDERIAREGVARVEDVAKLVPGVTFDVGAFPNDTRPAIRGMVAERGRPSVAVLLDGQDLGGENLYIAGGSSSLNTRLLDLERIEVVKGPQAALYGRNAFSGAINYVTRRPGRELAALAVQRVATNDPRVAAEQLEKLQPRMQESEKQWAWGQVGLNAAKRHIPEALTWYARTVFAVSAFLIVAGAAMWLWATRRDDAALAYQK